MNHLFTLLCGASILSAIGQVPDYLPSDGLVAWYPLNGDASGMILDSGDGEISGAQSAADRFGVQGEALAFDGDDSVSIPSSSWNNVSDEFSMAIWCDVTTLGSTPAFIIEKGNSAGGWEYVLRIEPDGALQFIVHEISGYSTLFNLMGGAVLEGWNHLGVSYSSSEGTFLFLNGQVVASGEYDSDGQPEQGGSELHLGARRGWGGHSDPFGGLHGKLDEFAFWSRNLDANEFENLFLTNPLVPGCTDASACNFDASANVEDGSCLDCDLFANRCLDGTIWSEELQGCVVANPSDTDFDSCVGMTDLLNLLSVFGTCAEAEAAEWNCGEPVGYQGYDYSTILIGEQCWFAENLRAEAYANGDEIESQLSESDWDGAAAGATAVYGDGDLTCYDYAPDLDACGPGQSLSTFGRVYNWHSIADERGMCPTGWQVPSDWDWSVMEQTIGMAPGEAESSGWRGTNEGSQLKSQLGWSSGNGTDNWSFNGLPAGHRHHSGNYFDAAGNAALFWTATELDSERAWFRILSHSESRIQRTPDFKTYGCSVRCIKDPQ